MGMFDSIYVSPGIVRTNKEAFACPLCDCVLDDDEFQTKDLGRNLDSYYLGYVNPETDHMALYKKGEDGNLQEQGEYPHQWINFYSVCPDCEEGWVELKVKFTDGITTKLERLSNEFE